VNWENLEQLGDFWVFQFPPYSNLLDKRLVIVQILGNWEGLLVNGKSKIQTRLEIGLWKIDGFEKVQ
jgi:hypothetical protein